MIGDEISCLKNVGPIQLNDATTHCQSLNADQVLPRSRQETDDLVSALLSLDLGNIPISIGIYKTNKGDWYDSAGQLISYFNWLPNEPDNFGGNQTYAGFRIDINGSSRWADYSSTDELNVVCTKKAGHGKTDLFNMSNFKLKKISGGQTRNIKSKA